MKCRGIYVQSTTMLAGPLHTMARLVLKTWQELLQDVHCVAQINIKLHVQNRPWRINIRTEQIWRVYKAQKKAAVLGRSLWCLCLAVLLTGCALLLFSTTGGRKAAFYSYSIKLRAGYLHLAGGDVFGGKKSSAIQQHMYSLTKLHFSSPSYLPLLFR